jgi:hypothetical protein
MATAAALAPIYEQSHVYMGPDWWDRRVLVRGLKWSVHRRNRQAAKRHLRNLAAKARRKA